MIKLINISKKYDEKSAFFLNNINLEINSNEIFGIVGKSGAGKTSIINIVSGLVTPDSGDISFNDVNLLKLNPQERRLYRKQIGFVFQNFNLLNNLTVEQNIILPLKLSKNERGLGEDKIDELIAYVGLTSKRNKYPHQLSGGEKQRVGIARALINEPKLLLCDEITASLDPETATKILNLLTKINNDKNIPIIFVSHDLLAIKNTCSRAAIIENGTVREIVNIANNGTKQILDIKTFLTSELV